MLHRVLSALILSHTQYGEDTGNPAATFHEVRVWKEEHEPKGKPLIPLRMVRVMRRAVRCLVLVLCGSHDSQISWGEEFDWPCARELFGSNLLVLNVSGEFPCLRWTGARHTTRLTS